VKAPAPKAFGASFHVSAPNLNDAQGAGPYPGNKSTDP
jgi:hypothetical protein